MKDLLSGVFYHSAVALMPMWQCLKKENASAPSCIVIGRVYLCLIRLVCRILLRRLSDRSALPSACLIRLVCCILLRRSSDRGAHPSACLINQISLRCILLCHSSDWCVRRFLYYCWCLVSFFNFTSVGIAFAAAIRAAALGITG